MSKLQSGKRPKALLSQVPDLASAQEHKLSPILDYILEHALNDERPYLRVNIMGKEILGLLDSGASRTILGSRGWKLLQDLGLALDRSQTPVCTVANGQLCRSIGLCEVPMKVRDRLRLIGTLVIPELSHDLILGADFWRSMGVVPDLRHNEWCFSGLPEVALDSVSDESVLTPEEQNRLQESLNRNFSLMGDQLGCTNKVEHVITTRAEPIKQRWYRVSPIMQKHIDEQLDEMLKLGVIRNALGLLPLSW